MKKIFFVAALFLAQSFVWGQEASENWVPVSDNTNNNLFINTAGLSSFTGDDIYVWIQQEYNSPITIEEIESSIYKTKTYYLMNKSLLRYSIQQIVYYDKNNNVITHYGYEHDSENPLLKYNYPIFKNSDAEKILLKCLEFVNQPAQSK